MSAQTKLLSITKREDDFVFPFLIKVKKEVTIYPTEVQQRRKENEEK